MTRSLALILFACLLALSACNGDKPKELLVTAEFEEKQMNLPHAKQLYEDVIRLYPTSKEAEQARARLTSLTPAQ
jgi:TolA-binding protein